MLNFDTMSASELHALKQKVDAAIVNLDKRQKAAALEAVNATAKEYGFANIHQLMGVAAKLVLSGKSVRPAKYVHPTDPKKTWSGRGRRPEWFNEALERGATPESLRI